MEDRLALLADRAVARAFASALGTRRVGRVIEHHARIATTMERAAELVAAGAADGTVVVADHQTAGRGRRGRAWGLGPPGSQLLASWILRVVPAHETLLVVLSAVALLEAARSLGVERLSVKWPNDLLLGGRKVAGVLATESRDGDGGRWLILGTGVDVHTRDHPGEVREMVTSFAREGHAVDRLALLARIAPRLEALVDDESARAAALARWREAATMLGARVLVDDGGRAFEAEAVDIDLEGALLVRRGGRIERVVAGDVSVRSA